MQGSNLRPSGPKPDALPTALHPDCYFVEAEGMGFEPMHRY